MNHKRTQKKSEPQMGFEPTTLRVLEGRGFESHLGLRFYFCPLTVDSLHLPFFPF